MRIGFIGTGVITQAVATGLIRSGAPFDSIALSPRNAHTAAAIAARDHRVQVCATNQAVLDASDVVVLAVIPQIVEEVVQALAFDIRHRVITLVPGTSVEKLATMVAPAKELVRAIPLPAVAYGQGITAVCPPDPVAKALFSTMGDVVEVDSEIHFDALQTVTATMASFYAVLESQALWLTRQGLPYGSARAFLSGYSVGLAHETTRTELTFSEMIDYLMTPGGLNEQLHTELREKDAYSPYGPALDRVFARVRGLSKPGKA